MPYVGDSLTDLIVTEPAGIAPVAEGDDALRQIKRYLVNTLGDPAAAGTVFDAVQAGILSARPPVGSILPYSDSGIWTAPTGFLKCDGNTIGDVSSGAFYESANYEALFNVIKKSYGNAGTEDFASGDTVVLPLLGSGLIGTELITTDITAITGNGGLLVETASEVESVGPNSAATATVTFETLNLSEMTLDETLGDLRYLHVLVEQKKAANNDAHELYGYEIKLSTDSGVTYEKIDTFTYPREKDIPETGDSYILPIKLRLPVLGQTSGLGFKISCVVARASSTNNIGFGLRATLEQVTGLKAYDTTNFIIKTHNG